jgi:II/X family phage/plasmid replication protein
MIDWISVVIPLRHIPIKSGHFLLFDEDGIVLSDKKCHKFFEGSHESKILLRSQGSLDETGHCTAIFMSGNPSKFLQGHNVFGHDGLVDLLRGCLLYCLEQYDLGIDPLTVVGAINGGIVSRIDFTKSIQFDNRSQVRAYIKQVSQIAHTRSGRPLQKKWTLAFQAHSRRWSLIVYSKGDELDSHKLSDQFEHRDYVQSEADKLVRVELRLKTLELKLLQCRKVYQLTAAKLHDLYAEYIGRVNMPTKVDLTSDQLADLGRTYRASYLLWKSGVDIQGEMTESTYYRHVAKIKQAGCDISVPYQVSNVSNVVPLKTSINGRPYDTPQEAIDKGLVYQPKQLRLISN